MSDRAIYEYLRGQFGAWLASRNGRERPNRHDREQADRAALAALNILSPMTLFGDEAPKA